MMPATLVNPVTKSVKKRDQIGAVGFLYLSSYFCSAEGLTGSAEAEAKTTAVTTMADYLAVAAVGSSL